jgi:phage gp36-like protein
MAYATQADLVPLRMTAKDLMELTDDDNTGAINTATVMAALEEASGRVESYCRMRYVIPLQQSDDVKAMTLDIAVYLLFCRRRETSASETVQHRFDQAISFLKDIAAARASLDQPSTALQPQTSHGGPTISQKDGNLAFSHKNLEGYI